MTKYVLLGAFNTLLQDKTSLDGDADVMGTLHQTFSMMFTKEHLETDTYLRPHLSSQLSLPIDIVAEVRRYLNGMNCLTLAMLVSTGEVNYN